MNGPGVAFECPHKNGIHLWEDSYSLEIVDPDTLEPLPDGEVGEIVLTTLRREAMPLIRYRTRDLARVLPGPCSCGRTHRRLSRIKGRTDDMLIVKGVNVYPIQVEQVLMTFEEAGNNYVILLDRQGPIDQMTVRIEVTSDLFPQGLEGLEGCEAGSPTSSGRNSRSPRRSSLWSRERFRPERAKQSGSSTTVPQRPTARRTPIGVRRHRTRRYGNVRAGGVRGIVAEQGVVFLEDRPGG